MNCLVELDFQVIYFFCIIPSLKLTSSPMKLVVGAKGLLFKGSFWGYLQMWGWSQGTLKKRKYKVARHFMIINCDIDIYKKKNIYIYIIFIYTLYIHPVKKSSDLSIISSHLTLVATSAGGTSGSDRTMERLGSRQMTKSSTWSRNGNGMSLEKGVGVNFFDGKIGVLNHYH